MAPGGSFTPSRSDGRPYWRVALEYLTPLAPGTVIEHHTLMDVLDVTDRALVYSSVARASKELRRKYSRDVIAIRGKGYRVLLANEHVGKAETHRDKARRQIQVANEVVDATDLAALTPTERGQWGQIKAGMVMLFQMMESTDREVQRHGALIDSLRNRVENIEGVIDVAQS